MKYNKIATQIYSFDYFARTDYNCTKSEIKTMTFDKAIVISWLIQTKSDRFMWQDVPNQDRLGLFDIEEGKFVTIEMLATYWSVWGRLIKKWWNDRQKPEIVTKPKKKWVPYNHGKHHFQRLRAGFELRMTEVRPCDYTNGTVVSFDANFDKNNWYTIDTPHYKVVGNYKLFRKLLPTGNSSFVLPVNVGINNLYKVEVYE